MMTDLNEKNIDGSVSSYAKTKQPGHGYYVPFSNPNFQEQVEENILPAVMLLNSKGYKTVTSCHGHSFFDYFFNNGIRVNGGPQITVELLESEVQQFINSVNSLLISTRINNSIEIGNQIGTVNISIKPRSLISKCFTNKFLCKQIYKAIENV